MDLSRPLPNRHLHCLHLNILVSPSSMDSGKTIVLRMILVVACMRLIAITTTPNPMHKQAGMVFQLRVLSFM